MKTYQINDILGFALSTHEEWHTLNRRLTEINLDTSLSRAERVQKAFDRLLNFYVRVGQLLLKYDVTNYQED